MYNAMESLLFKNVRPKNKHVVSVHKAYYISEYNPLSVKLSTHVMNYQDKLSRALGIGHFLEISIYIQ